MKTKPKRSQPKAALITLIVFAVLFLLTIGLGLWVLWPLW